MPSRNIIKSYVENSFYHIYNRGVAKQEIFLDMMDFKVFLKYLKDSLDTPPDPESNKISFTLQGRTFKAVPRIVKNFKNDIYLVAYCLMPNHFHLLLKQTGKKSITKIMRSLLTRYSRYFNTKYSRVGPVFQGRYKAILIEKDRYLLHLSRYIHLNPKEYLNNIENAYSSYGDYLNKRKTNWIYPEIILNFFNNKNSIEFNKFNDYKSFVENYEKNSADILNELTLE